MNYLKAVFWDYPRYQDYDYLKQVIQRGRSRGDDRHVQWIMARFLEYGRVIDTFNLFSIHEIEENLKKLRLSPYTRKKWSRMIEVYSGTKRG